MSETYERVHVRIRASLLERLNKRIWDPIRDRPRHGAKSALINKLLQDHLDMLDESDGKGVERLTNMFGGEDTNEQKEFQND